MVGGVVMHPSKARAASRRLVSGTPPLAYGRTKPVRFPAAITLAAALVAIPLLGAAATPKITDANFARASRCVVLASSEHMKAQGMDAGPLEAVLEREKFRHPDFVQSKARDAIFIANRQVRRADTAAELEQLTADAQAACAGFL